MQELRFFRRNCSSWKHIPWLSFSSYYYSVIPATVYFPEVLPNFNSSLSWSHKQKSEDWKKMTNPGSQQSQLSHHAEPVLRWRPSPGVSRFLYSPPSALPRHTHTRAAWARWNPIGQYNPELQAAYLLQCLEPERWGILYDLFYYYEKNDLLYQLLKLTTLSFSFLIISLCLLKGLVPELGKNLPAMFGNVLILFLHPRTFYMFHSV